ncbi:MAG: class I SAM-dependent methyltransferase [Acidimicrobiaceae bacterium]|nr:class I SAM-dependent methyltransferase [Acidimicrobiaceae bacterium]
MTSISNKKNGIETSPTLPSRLEPTRSPMINGSRWDQRYSQEAWSEIPDPELVDLAKALKAGKALDLGCGTGRNALWLASKGWSVTGVDSSYVGLSQARARARRLNLSLELLHYDLTEYIPSTGQYQLVIIANLHFAEPMRTKLFEIAKSSLATGGYIYFLGRHKDSVGHRGPSDPDLLFTEKELRDRLAGLEIVSISKVDRNSAPERPASTNVIGWAKCIG